MAHRLARTTTLFWLALAAPLAWAAEVEFDWSNNYAVIVGVLKWADESVVSFPPKDRQDQALAKTFRQLGMPEENLAVLLDEQATSARIESALVAVARRAKPGANLLFYYAGHGIKSRGKVYFANYDYTPGRPQTGFDLARIGVAIRHNYRGARVFLTADCCHSGALMEVAKELARSRLPAAALASSAASNVSTANWTFTQTLIDGLRGDPLLDENNNGVIELREIAWAAAEAMKHCEMQMFGWGNYDIEQGFPMAAVAEKSPPHNEIAKPYAFGQYVYANPSGRWRKGRVLDCEDGKYGVRIQYYSDRSLAWLPPDKLKPIVFESYPVGANLAVVWKGKEWKAKVLKEIQGFHYVTYPSYSSDWDEWVLSNRIVGVYERIAALPTARVQQGGKWWPAVILQRNGDKYLAHYTGYDRSEDEWVTADRIRGME